MCLYTHVHKIILLIILNVFTLLLLFLSHFFNFAKEKRIHAHISYTIIYVYECLYINVHKHIIYYIIMYIYVYLYIFTYEKFLIHCNLTTIAYFYY